MTDIQIPVCPDLDICTEQELLDYLTELTAIRARNTDYPVELEEFSTEPRSPKKWRVSWIKQPSGFATFWGPTQMAALKEACFYALAEVVL